MTRPEDAAIAEKAGAAYVGAVLVPGSPRCVSVDDAARIGAAVSVPLVIVIANLSTAEAIRAAERAGAAVMQLHGDESPDHLESLRDAGGWELWKAVRVRSGRDLPVAAERYGPVADLLLLDGWHPSRLGGTGTAFSWDEAASVRDEVDESVRPSMRQSMRLGVAGGLDPENVAKAVARLRPDLVDVSSGVESGPGVKDGERVREFVRRALAASERAAGKSP